MNSCYISEGVEVKVEELFLSENISEIVQATEETGYLFAEFPEMITIEEIENIFYILQLKHVKLVLVAPEKYKNLHRSNLLDYSNKRDILFLVTVEGLNGKYGDLSKILAENLLEGGIVSFVGASRRDELVSTMQKMANILSPDMYKRIFIENVNAYLNNDPINPPRVVYIKKAVEKNILKKLFRF